MGFALGFWPEGGEVPGGCEEGSWAEVQEDAPRKASARRVTRSMRRKWQLAASIFYFDAAFYSGCCTRKSGEAGPQEKSAHRESSMMEVELEL